jgi:hypothetical protein
MTSGSSINLMNRRLDFIIHNSRFDTIFLPCDTKRLKTARRLYGQDKEHRDLLVYFLWQRGLFTNEEIGALFGFTYSAVSHIVRAVKAQMKVDRGFVKKYRLVNSQIKM